MSTFPQGMWSCHPADEFRRVNDKAHIAPYNFTPLELRFKSLFLGTSVISYSIFSGLPSSVVVIPPPPYCVGRKKDAQAFYAKKVALLFFLLDTLIDCL